MTWDSVAVDHIGCRCVLKDVRNLRCVDHAVTLVLPREPKTVSTSGPPPYKAPDLSQVASPEVIAYRKREAEAALELARQKRTTATEGESA